VHWHKRGIIVQKLTSVVELWALCLPVAAIARAQDPTVIASVALRKGLRILCPDRSECRRALMPTSRNSPLWQGYEHCNVLFWPAAKARSIEQREDHVTCALIGTSRQGAAYNYTSSLVLRKTLEYELGDANGGIEKVRVETATRSAVATWI